MREHMRIGFIVNPVAGMGGKVGLKGTDGVVKEAIAKGAEPVAPQRAIEFLKELKQRMVGSIAILCCPELMGAIEAKAAGVLAEVLPINVGKETSAKDTENAVKLLIAAKVDLIVFVGGDGTARNILDATIEETAIPVLGVPSGVKMYSGIFAINPTDAAEAVVSFANGHAEVTNFEIMDADENAIRNDIFDVKLYGCLKGLSVPALIQGSKEVSAQTVSETESQTAIAKYVVEEMPKDVTIILGPGTTVERIAEVLGVKKTILGVDIYNEGNITLDVSEKTIFDKVKDWGNTWIILSPIGHQGILLGRGNQQISSEVVRRVGKNHILIVATLSKLGTIEAKGLRVDTGDHEVDESLRGEWMAVTGYREGVRIPVE
jgi:predicted polyphosphate/ATP-dependent NAD kinase